jgi:hypothetical protein
MPDLKLNQRWERFAPTLDGNDELPRPFFFEVACGLTRAEMRQFDDALERLLVEKMKAATAEIGEPPEDAAAKDAWQEQLADRLITGEIDAVATALEPYVRMGSEPLTIGGKPITTVRAYLEAVAVVADQEALREPLKALHTLNSLGGRQQLFSKRRSGGFTTTPDRSAAKKGDPKDGR